MRGKVDWFMIIWLAIVIPALLILVWGGIILVTL